MLVKYILNQQNNKIVFIFLLESYIINPKRGLWLIHIDQLCFRIIVLPIEYFLKHQKGLQLSVSHIVTYKNKGNVKVPPLNSAPNNTKRDIFLL
jgi:hypothetical protein